MRLSNLLSILLVLALFACQKVEEQHHGHDHEADTDNSVHQEAVTPIDEHDHAEDGIIHLSPDEIAKLKPEITTAKIGHLSGQRRIFGEITLNQERTTHVLPRYPGIIRSVHVRIGDRVVSGDTLVTVMNSETLRIYPIISEIDGEVVDKHGVVGELVDGSGEILTITDLSELWVDLHAYEQDLGYYKRGDQLTIYSVSGDESQTVPIAYIKPIMDSESRTTLVRCFVPGDLGWYPGKFVYGESITSNDGRPTLLIAKEAVQRISDEFFVFQPIEDDEFELHEIHVGRSNARYYEVTDGLAVGDQVVSKGAFDLKSHLVLQSISGHAGHGH